jgi:hypothetical protein
MTQLNRLQRLAVLSSPNEWSFYCAERNNKTASDRGNIYPRYPVGWAHSIRVHFILRIAKYRVNAKRMRIPHPLYGINISPTMFLAGI